MELRQSSSLLKLNGTPLLGHPLAGWQWLFLIEAIPSFVLGIAVAFILAGPVARALNEVTFLGFPLGYYVAAQGALAIYVIEIAVYAKLVNARDLRHRGHQLHHQRDPVEPDGAAQSVADRRSGAASAGRRCSR